MSRYMVFAVLIVGFIVDVAPAAPPPLASPGDENDYSPRGVFVVIESDNGWGSGTRSELFCDGRLVIAGAYADTTTIRLDVSPDSALVLVNELLSLNFFELPTQFGSNRLQLKQTESGQLVFLHEMAFDAGRSKIELHVGEREHSVTLKFPAHGAPEALHRWAAHYRGFIRLARGW